MSFLDAFGGQCANGRQILGQADADDNFGQFPGAGHIEQFERDAGGRMDPGGAPDRP